jgi:hypothetical protein
MTQATCGKDSVARCRSELDLDVAEAAVEASRSPSPNRMSPTLFLISLQSNRLTRISLRLRACVRCEQAPVRRTAGVAGIVVTYRPNGICTHAVDDADVAAARATLGVALTERSITAAGSSAAYGDRIVADTTSGAFSITLPAASASQEPILITNIGANTHLPLQERLGRRADLGP